MEEPDPTKKKKSKHIPSPVTDLKETGEPDSGKPESKKKKKSKYASGSVDTLRVVEDPEPKEKKKQKKALANPLDVLKNVDRFFIKQMSVLLEVFTRFENNKKYLVKTSDGHKLYYVVEESECCTRFCCKSGRSFDLRIFDKNKSEIIHVYRPISGACLPCPCCLHRLEVEAPPGTIIGTVNQEFSLGKAKFSVRDRDGDMIFRIVSPGGYAWRKKVFNVVSLEGEEVGRISKDWPGLAEEVFDDADFFGISFPKELDVYTKGLMLGACFMIDFTYFE